MGVFIAEIWCGLHRGLASLGLSFFGIWLFLRAYDNCAIGANAVVNKTFLEQSKSIASMIVGNEEPYNKVPWFWSNQYDIKLQIAGIFGEYDNYFITGSIQNHSVKIKIGFLKLEEKLSESLL